MEVNESEAIFESLNLNPKSFVNEVFNISDDLVNDAFDIFLKDASELLQIEGTDRVEHLAQGVSLVKDRVQFVLNKGLTAWENYCLQHCFSLPQGFTLPETNEVSVDTLDVDMVGDSELDAEIETLRNKLNMVGQECAGLSKELQTLDRQAVVSNHSATLINEALELYQDQSANDLFKELRSTSSDFRSKLEKFRNSRVEEMHQKQLHGIYKQNGNAYNVMHTDGLFNSKMEELQQLLKGINSVD